MGVAHYTKNIIYFYKNNIVKILNNISDIKTVVNLQKTLNNIYKLSEAESLYIFFETSGLFASFFHPSLINESTTELL